MHLVGNQRLIVTLGCLPETLVVCKRVVAQLVRVGKVDVVLHGVVPRRSIICIESRRSIHFACEHRLLLHQTGHSVVVRRIACIGLLEVRLVVWGHCIDGIALRNDIIGCTDTIGHIIVALGCAPSRCTTSIALFITIVADTTEQEHFSHTCYLGV